jgi:hypothetical protein
MARLLIVDLALREYHDDHGQYPTELSSLTPKYLAKVPYDPFNGQPFVYRPTDKEFVLYSVGGDEKDNGGAFPGRYFAVPPYEGYDLCLDKPFGLRN